MVQIFKSIQEVNFVIFAAFLNYSTSKQLQYNFNFVSRLKGVPLAIGPIKVPENATIIGTHSSMHLDVEVRVVVFRPKIGKVYKCTVTSVEEVACAMKHHFYHQLPAVPS